MKLIERDEKKCTVMGSGVSLHLWGGVALLWFLGEAHR